MKKTFILSTLLLVFLSPQAIAAKSTNLFNGANPFAIVELFTSEGCSSCPPADNNLAILAEKAYKNNERVFTLSFHVDYWDYLGWKDPFSSSAHSARQRNYARQMESTSVYTPQMIINGKNAFGGYRRDLASEHILRALSEKPQRILQTTAKEINPGVIEFSYKIDAVPHDSAINIALVQRNVTTYVESGENSGKVLNHQNVVRQFKSYPLKEKYGKELIVKPSEIKLEDTAIIAFVQNSLTNEISSANISYIDVTQ